MAVTAPAAVPTDKVQHLLTEEEAMMCELETEEEKGPRRAFGTSEEGLEDSGDVLWLWCDCCDGPLLASSAETRSRGEPVNILLRDDLPPPSPADPRRCGPCPNCAEPRPSGQSRDQCAGRGGYFCATAHDSESASGQSGGWYGRSPESQGGGTCGRDQGSGSAVHTFGPERSDEEKAAGCRAQHVGSFIEIGNHSAVDVGHLRRGIRPFCVQKPKFCEDYPEAAIREGADELTLRAEEVKKR